MFINSPNSKRSGLIFHSLFMFKPLDIVDQCGDGIGYRVYWKLHGDHKSNWLKVG